MTALEQLRKDLAATLTAAGLPAYGHVPERAVPPAAIIVPDHPYVAQDETTQCGDFRVRLRVFVVSGKGTNELEADRLDQLIVAAAEALDSGPWDGLEFSEPVDLELNGATYLGTIITLSTLLGMETL